jgi:hypothetical protein
MENRWYKLREEKPEVGATVWVYVLGKKPSRVRVTVKQEGRNLVFTDGSNRYLPVEVSEWKPI